MRNQFSRDRQEHCSNVWYKVFANFLKHWGDSEWLAANPNLSFGKYLAGIVAFEKRKDPSHSREATNLDYAEPIARDPDPAEEAARRDLAQEVRRRLSDGSLRLSKHQQQLVELVCLKGMKRIL